MEVVHQTAECLELKQGRRANRKSYHVINRPTVVDGKSIEQMTWHQLNSERSSGNRTGG